MDHRLVACVLASLAIAGCGASSARTTTPVVADGALPITRGARLYFASDDPLAPQELTIAITDAGSALSFQVGCGHVEPARALGSPITGTVDGATLESGRNVSALTRCDRVTEHDAAALPAFLVSTRALAALDRHEQTTLRIARHASTVALFPVGRETVSVRIDGRPTQIETVHARGDGMDLWIAENGTPIVVREVDHERGFTLEGIDTAAARTPHAR